MEVGENENTQFESTGDPALDILIQEGNGNTEDSTDPAPPPENQEPQGESQGETPTNESTENEGTEASEGQEQNQEATSEPASGEFDQNKFVSEMFDGRFETVEALKEANVLSKLDEFDQLSKEVTRYREAPEPEEFEYASNTVKELDEYMKAGGDAKTFFEIVSADYDQVTDFDLVKRDLMNKQGLTSDEANKFINYRYKLDSEEFTENEIEMGKLNMKMEGNKLRDEYKAIQEKARIPQAQTELKDFDESETERMDAWDNHITDTVSKMEDPTISLGKDMGDFKFQLTADDRKAVDEFVYDAIEGFGLDISKADPNLVQTMANNHIWATKGPEIVKSALAELQSKLEEKWFKDRHNPNPIPRTETPGGDTEVSKDEDIFNTIMKGEGYR